MRTASRLFLAVAVAALAVRLWIAAFPSPERLIRRQLAAVARASSFGPDQGALSGLASAARLSDCFAPDAVVSLDLPGRGSRLLLGREAIQQAALGALSSLDGLSVSLAEITVTVAPGGEAAVANGTLEARASGERDHLFQALRFELRKTSGQWLVTRVETVPILQK